MLLLAGSVHAADTDPAAEVKDAAQKLAGKANYSWVSMPKTEGTGTNWRQGPTTGQTEKGGYTYYKFEMGDNQIEAASKGEQAALKREGTWESAAELEGGNAWIARRLKTFKAPAAEAADLVGRVKTLKKEEGGLYSGDLTESDVKEMMSFGRRSTDANAGPRDTKGWVKFWIKDGELVKYQFNVQAKITMGQDQNEIEINRTTTVEVKDVGATKVQVPEEAKKKLS